MTKNNNQVNSRYTKPKSRPVNSYRKFIRAKLFPKGLYKYFN